MSQSLDDICVIPPYTDEQVMMLNLERGIDNLIDEMVGLPTANHPEEMFAACLRVVMKFKDDFRDGKIV